MDVSPSVKNALKVLIDIASHAENGRLVPVPDIAQRLDLSISRIELLLRPLREIGLIAGIKGRAGGYYLLRDLRAVTIKDIVLAMNLIKKRKVEVADIARDLYQTVENYMANLIDNGKLASNIFDYIPRFSEAKEAPERRGNFQYVEVNDDQPKKPVTNSPKLTTSGFKKNDAIPLGPNFVFNLADHINKSPSAN